MNFRKKIENSLFLFLVACLFLSGLNIAIHTVVARAQTEETPSYIRWVDFNIPYSALQKAANLDIAAHKKGQSVDWIELLACLATKYGDNWSRYKASDMDALVKKINDGVSLTEEMEGNRYFDYYMDVYRAVLGQFLGTQQREAPTEDGGKTIKDFYGLKAYFPLAEGFGYNHYDDFGSSRSYGYRRKHQGHDLMGTIGTPVVAVESGTIEHLGWNQYGGWRIGIRSFDRKRYYYYAHLRKGHPYQTGLKEGDTVKAGDVIGYLGMTGYSNTEDVNGMKVPHLHFGMQMIFDESQAEENEIWIDVYGITQLLEQNKATVVRNEDTKEYVRKYDYFDEHFPFGE